MKEKDTYKNKAMHFPSVTPGVILSFFGKIGYYRRKLDPALSPGDNPKTKTILLCSHR